MEKIGIFGSSFNPIHISHLILSEQARIRLNLDKVLFVPTANPYHKKVDLLDYDIRFEMTRRTINDNKYFEMSDIEKNIIINSYSYNVMKELIEINDANYYFIIGSDSINNLHTWFEYEKFLQLVNLVVFKRPGYDIDLIMLEEYRNKTSKEIFYYDDLQMEISSTNIRNLIKENIIPRYILKDQTIKFIQENNLWR